MSTLYGRTLNRAKFSPDGKRIVSNYGYNGAKFYIRSNQGGWLEDYIIHDEVGRKKIWDIHYSPDGTAIALNDMYRVEIHGQQGKGAWRKLAIFGDFDGCCIFSEIIFSPDGNTWRDNLRFSQ